MTAYILDGKAIAARIKAEIAAEVAKMKTAHGVTPGLAALVAADDPASQMYVTMKRNRCAEVGMNTFAHDVTAASPQEEVEAKLAELNADPAVHGILVQMPLPDHIDSLRVLDGITLRKDVDGLHPMHIGQLAIKGRDPYFAPATPSGVMVMLREAEEHVDGFEISGSNAVVLGRSNLVGMPMALLLIKANATVTIAHSRTKDTRAALADADIVVSAVGRPHMVPGEWIKPGAVVVDVATVKVDAPDTKRGYRWVGDVEPEGARERAAAISPVPGGVGPMTVIMLLRNTLRAAQIAIERGGTT
jgi:5,10-methylene-tetrahydrofolate dehydrogenase/methenyl tetrahydrofolate cyclohydrolase